MFHCAERVDFDAIFSFGNIYFASDAVEGAVPAEIISDIPQQLKEKAAGIFTIGPSAERDFWKKERSEMKINRGPCSSISSYTGHLANGLFRVKSIRLGSVRGPMKETQDLLKCLIWTMGKHVECLLSSLPIHRMMTLCHFLKHSSMLKGMDCLTLKWKNH